MINEIDLSFEAIAVDGNVGYASDYDMNGLYKVDLETGKCEYIALFPKESVDERRLHCCAKKVANRVYFIPAAGKFISVYDIADNSIHTLEIPMPAHHKYFFYKKKYKFIEAVVNSSYLWLIPSTYPGVIKVNLNTSDVQLFDNWLPDEGYMFRRGLCIEKNEIIIPSGNNNIVLIFDMKKEVARTVKIGLSNNGVMSMCKCNGLYWMAPRLPGAIISWNYNSNKVDEYLQYPAGFETGKIVFSKNYAAADKVFFPPAGANKCVVISEGKIEESTEICWKTEKDSMVEFMFESDNQLFYREIFSSDKKIRFFKIDKLHNCISDYSFRISDLEQYKKDVIEYAINYKEILKETNRLGLDDLINIII